MTNSSNSGEQGDESISRMEIISYTNKYIGILIFLRLGTVRWVGSNRRRWQSKSSWISDGSSFSSERKIISSSRERWFLGWEFNKCDRQNFFSLFFSFFIPFYSFFLSKSVAFAQDVERIRRPTSLGKLFPFIATWDEEILYFTRKKRRRNIFLTMSQRPIPSNERFYSSPSSHNRSLCMNMRGWDEYESCSYQFSTFSNFSWFLLDL